MKIVQYNRTNNNIAWDSAPGFYSIGFILDNRTLYTNYCEPWKVSPEWDLPGCPHLNNFRLELIFDV